MLLSVHGCPVGRPPLEEFELEQCVVPRQSAVQVAAAARSLSNTSRAPPSWS
jgi:hypothetical protein